MKKRKRILTALAVSIAMLGQTCLVSAEGMNAQPVQTETVVAAETSSENTVEIGKSTTQDTLAGTEAQDNSGQAEEPPAVSEEEKSEPAQQEEQQSYNVQVKGICLLNKGAYCEVGADYVSDDPNVEFKWMQYDVTAGQWTDVTKWNKSNWAAWKPAKSGDYWIYVEAKTTDGKTASSVYGYHFDGVQVSLNGICVIDRGTNYDIGVNYKSNDPGLKFQWKIYDLKKQEWKLIQKPVSGNWTTWKPEEAGDYWIYVEAIDSDGGVTSEVMGFRFSGLKLELNGICTIENKGQVDMGVAYKTNDSDVQFRWNLYDLSTQKWSAISNWNKGNWASWQPKKSGDYWLYVEAKTRDGQVKNQVMGYRVGKASIKSFQVSPESPGWTDKSVTLKGTYKDLIGEVGMSRFLVYDGKSWTEVGRNEESVKWQPSATGSYLLCYEIDDEQGQAIEQSFKGYSVETPYVNISGIYVHDDGNMQYSKRQRDSISLDVL